MLKAAMECCYAMTMGSRSAALSYNDLILRRSAARLNVGDNLKQ